MPGACRGGLAGTCRRRDKCPLSKKQADQPTRMQESYTIHQGAKAPPATPRPTVAAPSHVKKFSVCVNGQNFDLSEVLEYLLIRVNFFKNGRTKEAVSALGRACC